MNYYTIHKTDSFALIGASVQDSSVLVDRVTGHSALLSDEACDMLAQAAETAPDMQFNWLCAEYVDVMAPTDLSGLGVAV